MKKKKRIGQILIILVLAALLFIVLIPILWAISMSFDATTIDVI